MAEQTYGVFLPDGNGEPVAIFKDGDAAQQYRKTLPTGGEGVVAETRGYSANQDVKALFDSRTTTTVTSATADAEAVRKGEIRARIEAEEREQRLEREVRAEMDAERAAAADAEQEGASPDEVARRRQQARTEASGKTVELREPVATGAGGVNTTRAAGSGGEAGQDNKQIAERAAGARARAGDKKD